MIMRPTLLWSDWRKFSIWNGVIGNQPIRIKCWFVTGQAPVHDKHGIDPGLVCDKYRTGQVTVRDKCGLGLGLICDKCGTGLGPVWDKYRAVLEPEWDKYRTDLGLVCNKYMSYIVK